MYLKREFSTQRYFKCHMLTRPVVYTFLSQTGYNNITPVRYFSMVPRVFFFKHMWLELIKSCEGFGKSEKLFWQMGISKGSAPYPTGEQGVGKTRLLDICKQTIYTDVSFLTLASCHHIRQEILTVPLTHTHTEMPKWSIMVTDDGTVSNLHHLGWRGGAHHTCCQLLQA